MNPIIYCIRIRQFCVAFIEILCRKRSYAGERAGQFERGTFEAFNTVFPAVEAKETKATTGAIKSETE